MMDFEITSLGPAPTPSDIEIMVAKCMDWTRQKHAIANAIGGRLLVRRKTENLFFCCPQCFHAEKVFEFRIALPAEDIPKGHGWMVIEDRPDGLSNRSVDQ